MKRIVFPLLIGLALLMILSIFLPYASATEENAENLEKYSDYYAIEEINMTGEDLINISMLEYAIVYSNMSEDLFGDSKIGIIYVALVVLIVAFSLFVLIFAILKKPLAIIVFDVIGFMVLCVQNWDYSDRGIVPSSSYDWGIAYYLFAFCTIAVFLISITAMILQRIPPRSPRDFDSALDFLFDVEEENYS